MTQSFIQLLLSAAVMSLMACGGGGGGSPTTDPVAPAPGGNTGGGDNTGGDTGGGGTTGGDTDGVDVNVDVPDVASGANGLAFGATGQTLSDAEGVGVVTRSVSFESGSNARLDTAIVQLNSGFVNATAAARSGTVQIAGETVAITNGTGTLSSGETLAITFEPDRSGTYAGALEISIAGASGTAINGENAFVFGFETDPDSISNRTSGQLEYTGGFQAFGSLNNADNTGTEYEGEMTILVDFAGAGTADVTMDGQLNGTTAADLTGTVDIVGNGFAGGLTCAAGCTNNGSAISGGFFGPDADEVAGVVGVDIQVGGDEFDGVGSFVLTDRAAP